jgi:PAS domain S-box-containing protein
MSGSTPSSKLSVGGKHAHHSHLVQLYDADEQNLTENVTHFLSEGLQHGEGVMVIATPDHAEAFRRRLQLTGADPDRAQRNGNLLFLDAQELLAQFMSGGRPDRGRFDSAIDAALNQVYSSAGVRAYGEMVGILWNAKQRGAAIQLEALWNDCLEATGIRLFCGYPIDVFSSEFHTAEVDAILQSHTQLISSGPNGDLAAAVEQAMREICGMELEGTQPFLEEIAQPPRAVLPEGERAIRRIRSTLPARADEILARAQRYYSSERRFRALVENSSDAICLLGADGAFRYASSSAGRVVGYYPKELVGTDGFDLIHPDDRADCKNRFRAALAKPRSPIRCEARLHQRDGSWRWIENTYTNLLNDPDVKAIVVNSRDISARKADELRAQRDADELKRAYCDLQSFAYAATHDLREPLRSIRAFTELLTQEVELDAEHRQCAEFVVDGVKRMSALLDALLSWDRIKIPEAVQRVDLGDAARQAVLNLSQAIRESSAAVRIERLPAVHACQSHMVQLFQNLIGNAIKYRRTDAPQIEITSLRRGAEWIVTVRDNGIGVEPEYAELIFGLFKRLRPEETSGTGIGLALCRRTVEASGGRIWVDSEVGRGSAFRFTLPAL